MLYIIPAILGGLYVLANPGSPTNKVFEDRQEILSLAYKNLKKYFRLSSKISKARFIEKFGMQFGGARSTAFLISPGLMLDYDANKKDFKGFPTAKNYKLFDSQEKEFKKSLYEDISAYYGVPIKEIKEQVHISAKITRWSGHPMFMVEIRNSATDEEWEEYRKSLPPEPTGEY